MKRAAVLVAAGLAGLAISAQACVAHEPARTATDPALGWLAGLGGSCWVGHGSSGSRSEYCYRVVEDGHKLLMIRRMGARMVVESSIAVSPHGLIWRSVDATLPWQCMVTSPGGWAGQGTAQGITCTVSDSQARVSPPGYRTIHAWSGGKNRFHVKETYQYGGGAQGFREEGWTYSRDRDFR